MNKNTAATITPIRDTPSEPRPSGSDRVGIIAHRSFPHGRGSDSSVPRRAFTLIELLVVIAIIAILATVALPAVRTLSQGSSRSQAINQIRATLSQARSIAISQHRQAGVVFFEETPAHALAAHTDLTAMQLFVEDYNQSQYIHHPNNTIFIPYASTPSYLPATVRVAVLNDDAARGVTTGDEASSVSKTRAVLFDASGQMITRHGLARKNFTSLDWNFAPQGTPPDPHGLGGSDPSSRGISSPGIFLFSTQEFLAAGIPTDNSDASNGIRNAWIKNHADVVMLNANTGSLLQ